MSSNSGRHAAAASITPGKKQLMRLTRCAALFAALASCAYTVAMNGRKAASVVIAR